MLNYGRASAGMARALLPAAMRDVRRVIIVRRGEAALFESLRERFVKDAATVVMYDRRMSARSTGADDGYIGDQDRRWPHDDSVLFERGFYVVSRVQSA